MTILQEDALYEYLYYASKPFTVKEAVEAVQKASTQRSARLAEELETALRYRRLAFPADDGTWVSRRGAFSGATFAICPSRTEILNGILIPGHRCLPYANPRLAPHELIFFMDGVPLEVTNTEASPEDVYPYYELFGQEYAPQYIAQNNPENEHAFNLDPFEDPTEVSISTVDMRPVYRSLKFVPGDLFKATCTDWEKGIFQLEYISAKTFDDAASQSWLVALKAGFERSFTTIGPGASIEEQLAYACWFGGEALRAMPARPLEELFTLLEGYIDVVPWGMETRLWFVGKDIPDTGPWNSQKLMPDLTPVELILEKAGVPVSEYVLESLVRDHFYRQEGEFYLLIERILPAEARISLMERLYLTQYLMEVIEELSSEYNFFKDKEIGPLRESAADLHFAVIEYLHDLRIRGLEADDLPKQSFVVLSQLQTHVAYLLEDMATDESPDPVRMESVRNSLDAMLDTFDDVREAIEFSMDAIRRRRFTVVKPQEAVQVPEFLNLQLAISGTAIWRRITVPNYISLEKLHFLVQAAFAWSGTRMHDFICGDQLFGPKRQGNVQEEQKITLFELVRDGARELIYNYDYAAEWEVRISLLGEDVPVEKGFAEIRSGEGSAPPESCGGVARFKALLAAFANRKHPEHTAAAQILQPPFDLSGWQQKLPMCIPIEDR